MVGKVICLSGEINDDGMLMMCVCERERVSVEEDQTAAGEIEE